jgi:hypothetical protein
LHENNIREFSGLGSAISRLSPDVLARIRLESGRLWGWLQMRNAFVLLTSAISDLGLSQPTSAADMRVKAPISKAPIATPSYNWSGWYVGANIGGAWSNSTLTNSNIGTSRTLAVPDSSAASKLATICKRATYFAASRETLTGPPLPARVVQRPHRLA